VQTNNLAVGASVPYAQAGVGAIAVQFETNPMYGPRGLALLQQGKSPDEVMKQLLVNDGNFDGQGTEARQVGIVAADGRTSVFTGQEAADSKWAGSRTGKGYSIQGNGLAGPEVVVAMENAFLNTKGALPERLMAALTAGDRAGGQSTGRESAALLVRTSAGFPIDVDLRVDHSADPVGDLQMLLDIQMSRQTIVQASIAANKGQTDKARSLLITGVARAPMWARTWIQAARVADTLGDSDLAIQYLNVAFKMNATWADSEIGDGNYAQLGADPSFHQWVTSDEQQSALSDYGHIRDEGPAATAEDKLRIAERLLEIGNSKEALVSVADVRDNSATNGEVSLLKAGAYAALGQMSKAADECKSGLAGGPQNVKLRSYCAHWIHTIENDSPPK
jgi:uncharacterized Ntn-hydrolase superfamily protein